jgi:hypothetical protein
MTGEMQPAVDPNVFPLVLAPPEGLASLADACSWAASQRESLDARLRLHGAVLFRGFPVDGDRDFDAFIRAFDYPNFAYAESLSNAVRSNRTERVFTANEAPSSVEIGLHHEMAQTPVFPSRLFFFCERPADSGGATALCRSDALFEALAARNPRFAADCEEQGLLYSLVMPPTDDPGSGVGRSWRSTFSVDSRSGAEERMNKLGYTWEWLEGDCLRATTPVLPAVRQLSPGRKSFFNQLIAARRWKDSRNTPATAVRLGDGRPLDPEAWADVEPLAEAISVDLVWQRRDVALVDNFVVMHGRRSFEGKRTVLASLVAS